MGWFSFFSAFGKLAGVISRLLDLWKESQLKAEGRNEERSAQQAVLTDLQQRAAKIEASPTMRKSAILERMRKRAARGDALLP